MELPDFFVRFLTERDVLVVDIFSGSNTTGATAEAWGRRRLSIEERRDDAAMSALRFLDLCELDVVRRALREMETGGALDLSALRRNAGADLQGVLAL